MKKILYVVVYLLSAKCAYSQGAVSDDLGNLRDVYGAPVRTISYSNTKGTPFLLEDWALGTVRFNKGVSLSGVSLKYDIVSDMLIFKDPSSGEPLGFKDSIHEFRIGLDGDNANNGILFRKGYKPNPEYFYQVLVEGKVQLLKRISKIVKESREFNSASTTKTFYSVADYFIVNAGELTRIRKFKDSLAILEKKDDLESFIEKNKLILKSEIDLIKIITYSNSI